MAEVILLVKCKWDSKLRVAPPTERGLGLNVTHAPGSIEGGILNFFFILLLQIAPPMESDELSRIPAVS